MKTLYLECYSGISGDMTVAALLDLGADEKTLRDGLASLHVDGFRLEITRTKKFGISACDFDVILDEHEHEHDEHSDHHHYHRCIDDIEAIIDGGKLSANAKRLSKKIFNIVAVAEGKVHGLPASEVHFHEVGAVDSIVDIIGAAICLDNLGVEKVVCTPLREGQGTVKCQHGRVPVPAPATLEIATSHKIPLVITNNQGEMVTPTGAAIVAAIATSFDAPSAVTVLKTGYGAGKKDFAIANVLRASIIETVNAETDTEHDEVVELSCNIDDMTGEQLAYACEVMLENTALDCWCTPIIMKKGRPAQTLSLLVEPSREAEFTKLLFLHTSTIGVRATAHRRTKMTRTIKTVETPLGNLTVKESCSGDICKNNIEYESAKSLAKTHNIPINEVYRVGEASLK